MSFKQKKVFICFIALWALLFSQHACSAVVRHIISRELQPTRVLRTFCTNGILSDATEQSPAVIGVVSRLSEMRETFDAAEEFLFDPEEMADRKYLFKLPDHGGKKWGIWCRGFHDNSFQLTPSSQRLVNPGAPLGDQVKCLDEAPMTRECMLRTPKAHTIFDNPDLHRSIDDTFSWLTHLQHYEALTRMLDFTDEPVTALFFSVYDGRYREYSERERERVAKRVGRVTFINAVRLNNYVLDECIPGGKGFGVLPQEAFDIYLRAELTLSYVKEHLLGKKAIIEHKEYLDRVEEGHDILEGLEYPLAVEARRYNPRIQSQDGYFVIFGGKLLPPGMTNIPEPVSLEALNYRAIQEGRKPFLASVDIKNPLLILGELGNMGVSAESLLLSAKAGTAEHKTVSTYHDIADKWKRDIIKGN